MQWEKEVYRIYYKLLSAYGPQGWWPLLSHARLEDFDGKGYHPGWRAIPETMDERFEIACGAILTQNTAWMNVEKALCSLLAAGCLNPGAILRLPPSRLAELIHSAGYHNQKAKKIKNIAAFFINDASVNILDKSQATIRMDLLSIWGIGPETADSILLYAYGKAYFIIDTYTRRLFSRLGLFDQNCSYNSLQAFFSDRLDADARIFGEYHALIVEHAKRHCKSKPSCPECCLSDLCLEFRTTSSNPAGS